MKLKYFQLLALLLCATLTFAKEEVSAFVRFWNIVHTKRAFCFWNFQIDSDLEDLAQDDLEELARDEELLREIEEEQQVWQRSIDFFY